MGNNRIPEAIIFDFDGTLVDSEKITYELVSPIVSKYLGRLFTEDEVNNLRGVVWKETFKNWFPDRHEQLNREISERWASADPMLPMYPGVKDMLASLRDRGVRMAIASSREKKSLVNGLVRLSIDSYFEAVVGQEDTQAHKPHPDPLLLALSRMGIEGSSCIYIGDQVTDISASRSAGMLSGGASWGEGNESILKGASPDYIFTRPHDVFQNVFA